MLCVVSCDVKLHIDESSSIGKLLKSYGILTFILFIHFSESILIVEDMNETLNSISNYAFSKIDNRVMFY